VKISACLILSGVYNPGRKGKNDKLLERLKNKCIYSFVLIGSSDTICQGVSTTPVTNITLNSAICGGDITFYGGASVTGRGVCWNTTGNPTTSDDHTGDGSGTGNFSSALAGLLPGTSYYVRAYAKNEVGEGYGNEVSFTTRRLRLQQY